MDIFPDYHRIQYAILQKWHTEKNTHLTYSIRLLLLGFRTRLLVSNVSNLYSWQLIVIRLTKKSSSSCLSHMLVWFHRFFRVLYHPLSHCITFISLSLPLPFTPRCFLSSSAWDLLCDMAELASVCKLLEFSINSYVGAHCCSCNVIFFYPRLVCLSFYYFYINITQLPCGTVSTVHILKVSGLSWKKTQTVTVSWGEVGSDG